MSGVRPGANLGRTRSHRYVVREAAYVPSFHILDRQYWVHHDGSEYQSGAVWPTLCQGSNSKSIHEPLVPRRVSEGLFGQLWRL
jgi:hypothetical protein